MNLTTRIALTGMALAGGIGPAPAQAQHPDLSGHWTFDAAQSDDPRNRTQLGDTTGGGERGGDGRGADGATAWVNRGKTDWTVHRLTLPPLGYLVIGPRGFRLRFPHIFGSKRNLPL